MSDPVSGNPGDLPDGKRGQTGYHPTDLPPDQARELDKAGPSPRIPTDRLGPVRRRMRRLKTLPVLPTMLTAGNLICGITAVLCAAHANVTNNNAVEIQAAGRWLEDGAILVFIAMLFDMLDGKVARMTNTAGAFGAELDSLSDVVSFGVAPAILVHRFILREPGVFDYGERILWFLTVFYPVMASIRLARYNVEHSDNATPFFRGLPSPGAAALVVGWIIFWNEDRATPGGGLLTQWGLTHDLPYTGLVNLDIFSWFLLLLMFCAALLMVSTVRFPHVGNTVLGRQSFRKIILGLAVIGLAVGGSPSLALVVVTTGYVLWGVIAGVISGYAAWRKGRSVLDDEDEADAEDAGEDPPDHIGPAPGR